MNQRIIEQTAEYNAEPWYRVGMVWLVIALPLIVVVACMITINIAIKHSPKIISPQAVSVAAGGVKTGVEANQQFTINRQTQLAQFRS